MLQSEYDVTLKAMPTSVNRGALLEPHSTILVLDCSTGSQKLENFNFPAKQKFKWEPDNCGDVTLKIIFRDFTLTKKLVGPYAFPKLIGMFNHGSKTFTARDFPNQSRLLQRVKVNTIKVKYAIQGGDPLKKLRKKSPVRLPLKVMQRRVQGARSSS